MSRKGRPAARAVDLGLAVAIALLGLVLRLAYAADYARHPLGRLAWVDEGAYWSRAQEIVGGAWLPGRPFYQDPLYPYLLAGLIRFVGPEVARLRVTMACLGALNADRRLLGGPPGSGVGRGDRRRAHRRGLRAPDLHRRTPREGGDGRARRRGGARPDGVVRRPGRPRMAGSRPGTCLGRGRPAPRQCARARAARRGLVDPRQRHRREATAVGSGRPVPAGIRRGDRAGDGGQRHRRPAPRADPDHLAGRSEFLHR